MQLKKTSALSAGAGLLALGCVLGIAGGGAWALLRPGYVGEIAEGGVKLDQSLSPANVEFTGYGTFALLSTLAGVVVAAVALNSARRGRVRGSVAWLLWAGVVSAVSALALYIFGDWFVAVLHPLPDLDTIAKGDAVTIVPPVRPGAAWASAPFAAVLVYWVVNLLAYTTESAES